MSDPESGGLPNVRSASHFLAEATSTEDNEAEMLIEVQFSVDAESVVYECNDRPIIEAAEIACAQTAIRLRQLIPTMRVTVFRGDARFGPFVVQLSLTAEAVGF